MTTEERIAASIGKNPGAPNHTIAKNLSVRAAEVQAVRDKMPQHQGDPEQADPISQASRDGSTIHPAPSQRTRISSRGTVEEVASLGRNNQKSRQTTWMFEIPERRRRQLGASRDQP
jgi:hypothetical protein